MDFVYVLLLIALVVTRVIRLIAARRAKSAGSRLHLRLTGAFVLMALLPAVTVAVFAVISLNLGLETWFSTRVQNVVGASLTAARSYEAQQTQGLAQDAEALAAYLDNAVRQNPSMDEGSLRQLLGDGQVQIQRGLSEAYIIDAKGDIRQRGEGSYLFDYEKPDNDAFLALNRSRVSVVPGSGEQRIPRLGQTGRVFGSLSLCDPRRGW